MSGNANSTMEQLQKIRRQMEEQAKVFEGKEFEAMAGGDAVRVTVADGREVSKITLDKGVMDPSDVEMLEDLIKAVVSEALHMMEIENQ